MNSLVLERLADGGFVVTDAGWRTDPGRYCAPLFASSTLDEAFKFIRDKLSQNNTGCSGIQAADAFQRQKSAAEMVKFNGVDPHTRY